MSGSIEVRQFLQRFEADGQAAGVGGVPTQRSGRSGEAPRVSDDQVRRARMAVARGSSDVDDCATLLDMLGLKPDEDDGQPPVQR